MKKGVSNETISYLQPEQQDKQINCTNFATLDRAAK